MGAVTDNSQGSVGNLTITLGGTNSSIISGSGNGVTGNVGVNQASGTGNAQGNEAALASLQDANSVFASAQTFSTQVSAVNANLAAFNDNRSNLTNSFNNVRGNVGVNMASGSGNRRKIPKFMASSHTTMGGKARPIFAATGMAYIRKI